MVEVDLNGRLRALREQYDQGRALFMGLDQQRGAVAESLKKLEGAIELLLEMGASDDVTPLAAAQTATVQ